MKREKSMLRAGLAVAAGVLTYGMIRQRQRIMMECQAWQAQRRPALDVLACPNCHGTLSIVQMAEGDGYSCAACEKAYPIVNGIPHFIEPGDITGSNRRLAAMYDRFSWGYRAFSKAAFKFIGMTEEKGRREITDRLDPKGGRMLEVSIGPGVNLPYLVGRADVGEIYGLDISLGQLNRCREYVAHRGWDVQLQLGNAEQLPYQDNTFSSVFHVGGINFLMCGAVGFIASSLTSRNHLSLSVT